MVQVITMPNSRLIYIVNFIKIIIITNFGWKKHTNCKTQLWKNCLFQSKILAVDQKILNFMW